MWEGGVRVAGFVAGGFLPAAARGTVRSGLLHTCDWLATFASWAGVDPADTAAAAAGLPPIDSLNAAAYVLGANTTSPRTEVVLGGHPTNDGTGHPGPRAIIVGRWKLLLGASAGLGMAGWTGPRFPNASSATVSFAVQPCRTGCLYDLDADETEHHDVAEANPAVVARLAARLAQVEATAWAPARGAPQPAACAAAHGVYGGVYGPFEPVPDAPR